MKSKRKIVCILLACIAIVSVFAVLHFQTRDEVESGMIEIVTTKQRNQVDVEKLPLTKVSGQVKKGGKRIEDVSGDGILLREVIASAGVSDYESIRVISRDEYSATLTSDEIKEADVAYILLDDGAYRLYVFGDENTKRDVSDVVRIKIE